MKSKSNIVFLLLLLFITLSVVRAQDETPATTVSITSTSTISSNGPVAPTASTEPSAVEACLQSCTDDNLDCRAKCVGVPNPTEKQANDTKACIDACIPTDPTYSACRDTCIDTYYNPKQVSSSSAPSASASASGPATSASTSPTASHTSASGNIAVTSPFGSVFALLSALIVVFMSVCFF